MRSPAIFCRGFNSIRLAVGACEKASEGRAEFAGGEGVEGAEAGGEFSGGQAALAVEAAEKIGGGLFSFL
jgi:hypothetical protein